MNSFRITKYNPIFRGDGGAYSEDTWSSFSDIGKKFSEEILTFEKYKETEDNYVSAILELLLLSNVENLSLHEVETKNWERDFQLSNFAEHEFSSLSKIILRRRISESSEISLVARAILRETFWCKMVNDKKQFFVHFGWDYYMYIGTLLPFSVVRKIATRNHLFAEPFISPYLNETE